ncbi:MAG TPA: response regulator, partial [Terriglobales bacterium]|nr:response regulator [Terriglobales bacterium]
MGTGITPASSRPSFRESTPQKTILVVEDENFVCEVTGEILERSGYRVLRAESTAAARELFYRHASEIDLLLCDAVLPDGNGLQLSEELQRQSPGLKIVLASGYPPAALAREGHQREWAHFLTKPYSAPALLTRLKSALQAEA